MAAATTTIDPEFLSLVTSHQRKLYAFALTLLHDHHDADEVVQQANVVIWEKAGEFDRGTDFMAWAGRIVFLQAMAFRTQARRRPSVFDDELLSILASEAVDRLSHLDERCEALRICLRRLKPDQRALIRKRYFGSTSIHDLAAELQKTPAAVSESLRRIRERLGACISHRLRSVRLA